MSLANRCAVVLLALFFSASPALPLSLRIVRPQPSEILSLAEGRTFVIGTVSPPEATVSCNGVPCEVDKDGAFLGMAPIRRAELQMDEQGRFCDGSFEFTARQGDEETRTTILTITPRSPSAAIPAEEVFDPPRQLRATKSQWFGLNGARLGQIVCLPTGAHLCAISGTNGMFRCQLPKNIEINVPETETEPVAESPIEATRAYLLSPQEDTTIRILDLSANSTLPLSEPNPWGFETNVTSTEVSVQPKRVPEVLLAADAGQHPLRGLRVCLDPGHHPDPGAVGPRGFEERESNLLIARETARLLTLEGALVSFTREESPLPLQERHDRMRELKPDLVISIHNNSAGDGQDPRVKHGTQTFYLYPWSKPLAEAVHHAILRRMETADMGCHQRNLYLVRFHECPVILIEPEYIILPGQEKNFMTPEYRARLAGAVVEGIREFALESIPRTEP